MIKENDENVKNSESDTGIILMKIKFYLKKINNYS